MRVIGACLLAALAIWTLVALLIHEDRRITLQRAEADGQNLARTLAEHQDAAVRAVDESLRELREQWTPDAEGFDAAVAQLANRAIVEVLVLDPDDGVRYRRPPREEPLDLSGREAIQALKRRGADELQISEPVRAPASAQVAVHFMRPIYDADKRYGGAVLMAVAPPALDAEVKDVDLGPRGVVMLARADGTVLARTRGLDPARVVTLVGWEGLGDDGPPSGVFSGRSRFDGVERLFAYHRLPNYPLTVYVGQDAEAVLRAYSRERALLLGAGAIGTLLLAALAVRLARRRLRLAVREI